MRAAHEKIISAKKMHFFQIELFRGVAAQWPIRPQPRAKQDRVRNISYIAGMQAACCDLSPGLRNLLNCERSIFNRGILFSIKVYHAHKGSEGLRSMIRVIISSN